MSSDSVRDFISAHDEAELIAYRALSDDPTLGRPKDDACEHDSSTGADQSWGPDKVWICDGCGMRHKGLIGEVPAQRLTRRRPTP